jgi:hypothetical protein
VFFEIFNFPHQLFLAGAGVFRQGMKEKVIFKPAVVNDDIQND